MNWVSPDQSVPRQAWNSSSCFRVQHWRSASGMWGDLAVSSIHLTSWLLLFLVPHFFVMEQKVYFGRNTCWNWNFAIPVIINRNVLLHIQKMFLCEITNTQCQSAFQSLHCHLTTSTSDSISNQLISCRHAKHLLDGAFPFRNKEFYMRVLSHYSDRKYNNWFSSYKP